MYNQRTRTPNPRGSRPFRRVLSNRNKPSSAGTHPSRYINKAVAPVEQVVTPIKHTFADFNLHPQLAANIASHGFTVPTPIQDQAIPHLLSGRDVIGIANTGTGKTAAFLIPLLQKILTGSQVRVLILVPTRELAVQIQDELKLLARNTGLSCALCIGGASMEMQLQALRRDPTFIIGTPGRIKDLTQRKAIPFETLRAVVLDEVDRMVDIGFIHDIRQIIGELPSERQSLFFSATMSAEIQPIVERFLRNPVTVSVKMGDTAQSIEQDIIEISDKREKFDKLVELLKQEEFAKVLIFGRTKWGVERLATMLHSSGFNARSIHGNKTQGQRQRTLDQFKQDHTKILVATDVAARGLDIDDITHVINYDEPKSYDDYVHRIGRTGRGNKQGKALTFVG